MEYEITLHRGGTIVYKFIVPAVERHVIGNRFGAKVYGPDESEVINGLPYQYRKAFERGSRFWSTNLPDVQRADMNRKSDNAPMGCLFARLIMPSEYKGGNPVA